MQINEIHLIFYWHRSYYWGAFTHAHGCLALRVGMITSLTAIFYFTYRFSSFFIGPVGLLYVLYLLNPGFKIKPTFFYHFLPGILYLTYSIVCFVADRFIYHSYVMMDGVQDPDFDNWYQYLGLISIAAYFFTAYRYYINYRKMILNFLSNADAFSFTWIRNFFVAVLAFIISWLSINLYSAITGGSYTASWWYF
jgi:hypothetical protein